MPSLSVSPNPANVAAVVSIAGVGFNNRRIRLLLDGVGATTNTFRAKKDGTFQVGITVSASPKTQTLVAEQLPPNGVWTKVAQVSIIVQAVVVPPPPPVDPVPTVTSQVTFSEITQTSVKATWTCSEPVTGQLRYGLTTAYGSLSAPENTITYATHSQTVTGLTAGSVYHFQPFGVDAKGQSYTGLDRSVTTLQDVVVPPPPPPTGKTYGPGIASDALNNSRLGYQGMSHAYMFRAEQSSTVNSLNFYIISPQSLKPGYAAGTGGTVKVDLHATDANGFPTGPSLATASVQPGFPAPKAFWDLPMTPKYTITKDTRYAFVFTNPDPDPDANHVSIDGLYTFDDVPQPRFNDADMRQYIKIGTGWWGVRTNSGRITPIFDITYGNGAHQGQGYMEVWQGYGEAIIDGTKKWRETFTVTGGDRVIGSVGLRIARASGSAPLTLTLESGGATVATSTIASTLAPNVAVNTSGSGQGQKWVKVPMTATLKNGQSYNLVLTTVSGTVYWTTTISEGSSYGMQPATYFADGKAQEWDGTQWLDTKSQGGTRVPRADLQLYFDSTDVVTPPSGLAYPATRNPLQTLSMPAMALPPYLSQVTDPTFGTKIMRITNVAGHRNQYAKYQAWNKDQTLISMPGYGGHMYDAKTYADLGVYSTGMDFAVWSNLHNNRMYGCNVSNNVFKQFNTDTKTTTPRRTFTGYTSLTLGKYEGTISENDRCSLIATDTNGAQWVIVYDIENDVIVSRAQFSGGIDNCQLSRSGEYSIIGFSVVGSGNEQGTQVYRSSDMGRIRQITGGNSHQDMARLKDGSEVYVGMSQQGIRCQRLDTGLNWTLTSTSYGLGHVGVPCNRPGFALMSSTEPSGPGARQIFMCALDGSGDVEPFAFDHMRQPYSDYNWDSPFASPNRDGTIALWGLRWDGNGGAYSYVAGMKL